MIEEILTYRQFRIVEARQDKRMSAPSFQVQLEGVTLQTANWSLGGIYLRDYPGTLEMGQTVEGVLVGTSRLGMEQLPFTAEVVRIEPDGSVGLHFAIVDSGKIEFFERCLLHRMRPRSVAR
jgi:hypothetical protein